MKYSHCSECGSPYEDMEDFPRHCPCGAIKWDNPIPVSVVIQPIVEFTGLYNRYPYRSGIAVARRAINPGKGMLGLVGGFVEKSDASLEDAASREFLEETGLSLPERPRIIYSSTNVVGNCLVFCLVDTAMDLVRWQEGVPCHETEELDVLWRDDWQERLDEFAFPLHKEAVTKWFEGRIS